MNRGLEFLTKVRMSGAKPNVVWVLMGNFEQPKFWRWADPLIEIAVKPEAATLRLDWRPLVGCSVMILADEASETLRQFVSRVEGLASRITVFVASRLPDDLGRVWERELGWRRFGDGPQHKEAA